MNPADIVSEILDVYRQRGHRHYGENVTEEQHALQCATLAHESGEPPDIVVSCLLHDYGHLLHDLGEDVADHGVDARHEQVGANRLEPFFAPEVVEPIRLHAESKRYLCWKENTYLDGLSEASRKSLALQGGPMSDAEARAFEHHPHFERAIRVRRYDDRGKVAGMETPGLDAFRHVLESLVVPRS
ncbi:MAG: HD domain-containing protein [Verrucomicrobiales bacterium]|nr:HD domain-containing protein [Verrucomicrobiales bacterium]